MTEEQKAYIEQNVGLIENSEWKKFFEYAPEGTGLLLYKAQVDFLADVSAIFTNMFYGSTITEVDVPTNIKKIDRRAFFHCINLTTITIPDSVTFIGDGAFSGCTSLTSAVIPDNRMYISDSAFSNCSSLTSITIPESVTSIGDYAFKGCTSLKKIRFEGTQAQWRGIKYKPEAFDGKPVTYIQCSDGKVAL